MFLLVYLYLVVYLFVSFLCLVVDIVGFFSIVIVNLFNDCLLDMLAFFSFLVQCLLSACFLNDRCWFRDLPAVFRYPLQDEVKCFLHYQHRK